MNKRSTQRLLKLLVPGMVLLQTAGCDLTRINLVAETAFFSVAALLSAQVLQDIL